MKLLNGLFSITFLAVTLDLNSCSQRLNTHKSSGSEGSANFISQCIDLANLGIGLQCSGIVCKGEEGATLSLEQLQVVECEENSDCRAEDTGMECVKGRCDCPPLLAFNVTSCSCQQAARCTHQQEEEEEENCPEHNGRKCEDRYCSCYSSIDYATLLVDPSSLFCLLPSDQIYPVPSRGSGAGSLGLAVLGALIGFVCVVAGAALVMGAYKHCVCQKVGDTWYRIRFNRICSQGVYQCDAPADIPEDHIAAWDHPSLDYIPHGEEDIVFTLCQVFDIICKQQFLISSRCAG